MCVCVCSVDNDKNPREYLGRFWLDSLVHDPVMLKHVVETFGEDKIMLGTDYPFPLGDVHPVRCYLLCISFSARSLYLRFVMSFCCLLFSLMLLFLLLLLLLCPHIVFQARTSN